MFSPYNRSLTRFQYSGKTASFVPRFVFNMDLFLSDFEATDFNSLVNEGVNQRMNNVINALQSLSNKHAPLRKLSNKKKKSHFLSNDPDKVTYYKSYNNNLQSNQVKRSRR